MWFSVRDSAKGAGVPPLQHAQASTKSLSVLMDERWFGVPAVAGDVDDSTHPGSGGYIPDPYSVRFGSWLVDKVSVVTARRERLRAMRNMVLGPSKAKMNPSHTHPAAASMRAHASVFLSEVAKRLGKRRYDVTISSRERGMSNTAGSRQFRVLKDTLSDRVGDKLRLDDFVTMVDTDYYMSEGELSKFAGHDIGLYALRPNSLSGTGPNSAWSFVNSNTVIEEVEGGAVYKHQVWDWHKDIMVLPTRFAVYIYDVILHDAGFGRVIVVLLLARRVGLPAWVANFLLPGTQEARPQRMEVHQQGQFLVGCFGVPMKKELQILECGLPGAKHVALPPGLFASLATAAKIPNTDRKVPSFELLPSTVEQLARRSGAKLSTADCYAVSKYFSTGYHPHEYTNYQTREGLELEDGDPTVRVAAVPLVGGGVGPTSSSNNEARAIKARVDDVRNDRPFSEDLKRKAAWFVEAVVPNPGLGVPAPVEELRKQQDKPMQRARRVREEPLITDPSNSMQTTSFQKREAYAKVGDPRLINQVTTDHTTRLGVFSMAIKGHLKKQRWYMVGKKPAQIASSLQGMARDADGEPGEIWTDKPLLVGGDYSRMDGRTSVDYRVYVLEPLYKRFFGAAHLDELELLFRRERTATTSTRKFGHKTRMAGANLSGSGITTDLNTINAAFNEFAAIVDTMDRWPTQPGDWPEGVRKAASARALASLGAYFGDDSVVRAGHFAATKAVADATGMKLELEPVPEDAGRGHVVFLSRVYPDILTSLASHPVMDRALKKLCTVTCGKNTPHGEVLKKLALKVDAVLETEPNVPLLSSYAAALHRVYGLGKVLTEAAKRQATDNDADYRRKREVGAYPTAKSDRALLYQSVAKGVGLSTEEVLLLDRRLDGVQTEDQLVGLSNVKEGPSLPAWARWVPLRR